jgi:hypothetical protein
MQISGVSLALTWPLRLCLLRVLLCASLCYKLSPFQAHWGRWHCTSFLWPVCLFTAQVGSGSSPLSFGVFLPRHFYKLSHSWLLGVCHRSCLLWPSLFIYSSKRDSPPSLFSSGCPTLFATCLYCCYCLLLSFSFFLGWGSVCPEGCADLAQGCLWEYCVWLSSPCGPHRPKPSGHRRLAAARVSPFNVKWRCSVQAGAVEGSKFCLFSVVLSVRCISSISPKFSFRRHAFCFLPLATISES